MRKLVAWVANAIGIRTFYHVSARYVVRGKEIGHIDMTMRVSPWIHERNIPAVRQYLADQVPCASRYVNIVSITRIGA